MSRLDQIDTLRTLANDMKKRGDALKDTMGTMGPSAASMYAGASLALYELSECFNKEALRLLAQSVMEQEHGPRG